MNTQGIYLLPTERQPEKLRNSFVSSTGLTWHCFLGTLSLSVKGSLSSLVNFIVIESILSTEYCRPCLHRTHWAQVWDTAELAVIFTYYQ